jgi:methionyl aminopeptidase
MEILDKCLKAGKIASLVKKEGAKKLSEPGTSFLEVMDYCEKRIIELGGGIAWAQFGINEIAAHDCCEEDDDRITKEGDLVKIDIGVHEDGYIADNAMTVVVGGESNDLMKASQNALNAAIKLVRPGTQLWELGEAQSSEAEALGFRTVKNLCGHNLKQYQVHAGVSIPSFNNKEKTELQAGWQIAIEPFVTDGDGLIKEKGKTSVFMVHKERGVRSPYARKILEQVKTRNGLPFTIRDLTKEIGKGPAALGLRELQQLGVVKAYPPLGEISNGLVAQFEHSMLVGDKTVVYTKDD